MVPLKWWACTDADATSHSPCRLGAESLILRGVSFPATQKRNEGGRAILVTVRLEKTIKNDNCSFLLLSIGIYHIPWECNIRLLLAFSHRDALPPRIAAGASSPAFQISRQNVVSSWEKKQENNRICSSFYLLKFSELQNWFNFVPKVNVPVAGYLSVGCHK